MSGEPLSRAQVEELCNGKGELTKQGWRMLLDTDAALRAQLVQVTVERDDIAACVGNFDRPQWNDTNDHRLIIQVYAMREAYDQAANKRDELKQQLAEAQARIKELEGPKCTGFDKYGEHL